MLVSEEDGRLSIQVFAIGPDDLIDWGKADVVPLPPAPRHA